MKHLIAVDDVLYSQHLSLRRIYIVREIFALVAVQN